MTSPALKVGFEGGEVILSSFAVGVGSEFLRGASAGMMELSCG